MSSFLGPIHHWLYNKIQLQQAIIDKLYTLGAQYGLTLKKDCDNRFGIFENKPLEEMIDHGNIHGWLQERVSQVEYKYAYTVTTLIASDADVINQLKSFHTNYGKELALSLQKEEPDSHSWKATNLYKLIFDHLLDGMPCDHANRVLEQNDTEVLWTRNTCVHTPYWEEVDGDIKVYYELRYAWMEGFVNEFGYCIATTDESSYSINKKEA